MATDTGKLVEQLGSMSVLELVELKNKLEEEWGITAAAPVAVAAPGAAPAAGDGAAAEEEKTSFDVVLTAAGGQKIQVVKEGVAEDEANSIKAQLEEAGATVEVT